MSVPVVSNIICEFGRDRQVNCQWPISEVGVRRCPEIAASCSMPGKKRKLTELHTIMKERNLCNSRRRRDRAILTAPFD